jgi:predicted Fe-Mo cluster-binding NifX family protein
MKIAVSEWSGRVAPVFDVCGTVTLLDTESGERKSLPLAVGTPSAAASGLLSLGAAGLVCGAVSAVYEAALREAGIEVAGFVRGDMESVTAALMRGDLSRRRFMMPGCRRRHGQCKCFRGCRK